MSQIDWSTFDTVMYRKHSHVSLFFNGLIYSFIESSRECVSLFGSHDCFYWLDTLKQRCAAHYSHYYTRSFLIQTVSLI